MKTILHNRLLIGMAIGVVVVSVASAASAQLPASQADRTKDSRVPVQTLSYQTNADTANSVVAEEVRWGRRSGPPYRSYYFSGPARYPTYYSAPQYGYRPYRSSYNPGYYGRGYYGDPWGGVRIGRSGVYWR